MKEQKKISLESLVSEIEKNGRIGRLGKVFKTEKNYYFYDTGTGKVAKLNSNVYIVLKSLLEGMPVEDIKNLQLSKSEFEDAISEIKSAMENEHILQAPPLKTLTGDAVTELDDILENKVENVTLEVTEKCNLRCKYCIYHPSHPEYRAFGHENMKWDVAKKAIDFLKEHSQNAENRHIGFYGGEPLLNFELIERAVEYAKKLFGEDIPKKNIYCSVWESNYYDDQIPYKTVEHVVWKIRKKMGHDIIETLINVGYRLKKM